MTMESGPVRGAPPSDEHQWRTKAILIPNVGEKKKINICDALVLVKGDPKEKRKVTITLPPEVYPPKWDYKDALATIIKNAAMESEDGKVVLHKCRTGIKKTDDNVKHFYLQCRKRKVSQGKRQRKCTRKVVIQEVNDCQQEQSQS